MRWKAGFRGWRLWPAYGCRWPQDYRTFWTQFGRVLKEGLMLDFDNQDMLLRISSFASTHSDVEPTTLAEYVERMKDGQEQIFCATGASREQLLKSPHLEAFKAEGYEVLLLTDPVDEIWVGSVTEFDGKPLYSVRMPQSARASAPCPT